MASEYTPNRRYPLYTDYDKPNLRDQYNGAIREIDSDMADALHDSQAVADALGSGFDAQHTVRMALDEKATSTALTTETNAREAADTALGTRITSEATRITNETSARQSADTALGTRIDNEVSARQSADTALDTRIDNEVSARQSADNAINSKLNVIENPIIVIIGDSYAQGYTPDGTVKSYIQFLTESLPAVTFKHAEQGGASFGGSTTFLNLLTTLINGMTAAERERVVGAYIVGGANDHNTASANVSNGIRDCRAAIINNFPNCYNYAIVFVGAVGTKRATGSWASVTEANILNGFDHWSIHAASHVIPMVDGTGVLPSEGAAAFSSDFVHPNETGQKAIAQLMLAVISGAKSVAYSQRGGLKTFNATFTKSNTTFTADIRVVDYDGGLPPNLYSAINAAVEVNDPNAQHSFTYDLNRFSIAFVPPVEYITKVITRTMAGYVYIGDTFYQCAASIVLDCRTGTGTLYMPIINLEGSNYVTGNLRQIKLRAD